MTKILTGRRARAGLNTHGRLKRTGSAKAIVFVHGLGGNYDDPLFKNASHYFAEHGFDSFCLDLYRGNRSPRRYCDTAIEAQIADFSNVIDSLLDLYRELHVVAHSLGCPTVLMSAQVTSVTSLVFWDPSRQPQDMLQNATYCSGLHAYKVDGWPGYIVDPQVIEGLLRTPPISVLLHATMVPIQIIGAGKGGLHVAKNIYFDVANEPKAFFSIGSADHDFTEEGAQKELFAGTLLWLQRGRWRSN